MASAISSSSACGLRSQAMTKALAVERLMPAKQWTTIGAARVPAAAEVENLLHHRGVRRDQSVHRHVRCRGTPSRRCRSAAKPGGVSIMLLGRQQRDEVRGRARLDHLGQAGEAA